MGGVSVTVTTMKPGLQSLWLVLAFVLAPAPVLALSFPDPLSQDELVQRSDLVALVRVVSVTCIATAQDEDGREVPVGFSATLKLLEIRKGSGKAGDIVTLFWGNVPGDRTGAHYPGEEVWTHLTRENGAYRGTWWNAKGPMVKEPVSTALPTRPGETLTAD